MISPFDSVPAHALTNDQHEVVRTAFGSIDLPRTAAVSFDGKTVRIENFDLAEFLKSLTAVHGHCGVISVSRR